MYSVLTGFTAFCSDKYLTCTQGVCKSFKEVEKKKIPRKIEFPLPDEKTKRRIFGIHTGWNIVVISLHMCFVSLFQQWIQNYNAFVRKNDPGWRCWPWRVHHVKGIIDHGRFNDESMSVIQFQDDLSGADIKAICTEAGLLALRERRMKVKIKILFQLLSHSTSSSHRWPRKTSRSQRRMCCTGSRREPLRDSTCSLLYPCPLDETMWKFVTFRSIIAVSTAPQNPYNMTTAPISEILNGQRWLQILKEKGLF